MHNEIILQGCKLRFVTINDTQFIKLLFSAPDIRKYYVLRADHAQNLNAFANYMVEGIRRGIALTYIIEGKSGEKVGLITAELIRDERNGNPIWNVGYAIHPNYRLMGYATAALNGLSNYILQSFSIQEIQLHISAENKASEIVAQKCGFKKPNEAVGNRMGYFDFEHEELGIMFKWYKSLTNKRIVYFNQAAQAYRSKNYAVALSLFKKALQEDYPKGTPYTDAQIYSNMGMTYSSLHMYEDDFRCLKKAQSLGLNNPSIEKELLWLRNNIGLY